MPRLIFVIFSLLICPALAMSSSPSRGGNSPGTLKQPASQPDNIAGSFLTDSSELESYIWAFSYVKNANQRAIDAADVDEPPRSHYRWALSQTTPQPIFREVSLYCDKLSSALLSNSIPKNLLPYVFADIKMASLHSERRRSNGESFQSWLSWARSASETQLRQESLTYLNNLRSKAQSLKLQADRTLAGGKLSQTRLSKGFAQMKNAYLQQVENREEPLEGHQNWALNQSSAVVRAEIIRLANLYLSSVKTNRRASYTGFSYLKNAHLWLEEGREEPPGQHIGWAKRASSSQYFQAIQEEVIGIQKSLEY